MPFYAPTIQEVSKLVGAEGSFYLNKLKSFTVDWSVDSSQNLENRANFVAKSIRAVTESLLDTTFGAAIMDDLFYRFKIKVKKHLSCKESQYLNIVVSLIKTRANLY